MSTLSSNLLYCYAILKYKYYAHVIFDIIINLDLMNDHIIRCMIMLINIYH